MAWMGGWTPGRGDVKEQKGDTRWQSSVGKEGVWGIESGIGPGGDASW